MTFSGDTIRYDTIR